MRVKLTYFKPTGKFYSQGEYDTSITNSMHVIFTQVALARLQQCLPGLVEGHGDFIVLVDVPDHPHNHPHLVGLTSD